MPELTVEQIQEMNDNRRELARTGNTVESAKVREALMRGEYLVIGKSKEPDPIDPPKRNATKLEWQEFAKKVSEIDHDVIDNVTRDDIIQMLKANGLLPMEEEAE